jgi:hypothetical protein
MVRRIDNRVGKVRLLFSMAPGTGCAGCTARGERTLTGHTIDMNHTSKR